MQEKFKTIFGYIVPYAFLCAGLYQISFWSTFNINIFSFLDISDIIKSFIYPFFYSCSIFLVINFVQIEDYFDWQPYERDKSKPRTLFKRFLYAFLRAGYFGLFSLIAFSNDSKFKSVYIALLSIPFLHYFLSEYLIKDESLINKKYKFLIITLIVILPASSFVFGKLNSIQIHDNYRFNYTVDVIKDKPLKFLGKASNHYIFATVDNEDKYFYEISDINGLHIKEFNLTKNNFHFATDN
ncbi:MAG: hypothetical protein V4506_02065 [Bacteroidota bacterium]